MEPSFHHFADLFAQLGLPNSHEDIRQFLATHAPLPDNMRLEEAPFWTPAQAQLLREERVDDADWVEEQVAEDYALNRLVSFLDRDDLSLRMARKVFGETFLGT